MTTASIGETDLRISLTARLHPPKNACRVPHVEAWAIVWERPKFFPHRRPTVEIAVHRAPVFPR
jgi:hypothetical protein